MKHFEEKALDKFTSTKPLFYRRYVDDSFIIFENQAGVQPLFDYMNSLYTNIQFTKEEESPDASGFSFLNVYVTKGGTRFHTNTYYKPTHTGQYTHLGNTKST